MKYCDELCVCLSIAYMYVRNHTSELHQILCVCPSLVAFKYIMQFRFCGWHHVSNNGTYDGVTLEGSLAAMSCTVADLLHDIGSILS